MEEQALNTLVCDYEDVGKRKRFKGGIFSGKGGGGG